MSQTGEVLVVFVDADSGQEFGRTQLLAGQLPDGFRAGMTLPLGDSTWSVVAADPPEAVRFVPAGHLVLTLRRVDLVAPQEILYSLPTICDALPTLVDADPAAGGRFELHEDDWRQIELVQANLAGTVQAEVGAVHAVYDKHARAGEDGLVYGFEQIHLRSQPADPLPRPLSWGQLVGMLPASLQPLGAVGFAGRPGVVPGSFAAAVGPVVCYGVAAGDAVGVLGLHVTRPAQPVPAPGLVAALRQILRAGDLILVDWCQCAVVGPASVAEYLAAVGAVEPD